MTSIRIKRKEGAIVFVGCIGHTGYGGEGEDIVCAALSSVVQTAILGLLNVAGINISYTIIDQEGSCEFSLPQDLSEKDRHNASIILETMLCGIADLNETWGKYIKLKMEEI